MATWNSRQLHRVPTFRSVSQPDPRISSNKATINTTSPLSHSQPPRPPPAPRRSGTKSPRWQPHLNLSTSFTAVAGTCAIHKSSNTSCSNATKTNPCTSFLSIGLALTDMLDDLISEERIHPQLAMKILANFDQAITEALQKSVKARLTFKVRTTNTFLGSLPHRLRIFPSNIIATYRVTARLLYNRPKSLTLAHHRAPSAPTVSATKCGPFLLRMSSSSSIVAARWCLRTRSRS